MAMLAYNQTSLRSPRSAMPPPLTIKMEGASARKPRQTMRGHTMEVSGVVYLPDGRRIITCSRDGSLRLWNLESGVQIGNDWRDDDDGGNRRYAEVLSIALSPNGKTVASGSMDGKVRLWDVEMKKVVVKWTAHVDATRSLCWSVDGGRVVSGSNDGTMRVWDVESGDTVLGPIKTGHEHVTGAIFSPDTTKIATSGYYELALKIWDAKTGNLLSTVKLHSVVFSLAWTSDQKKFITGSYASIRIFDTATWQQIAILEGHVDTVWCLSLFQNNHLLASGSLDRTARLWNLDTNLPVGPPIQHESIVCSAAISDDGKQLVTGCSNNNAHIWDIHTTLKDAGLEDLLSIHDAPPDGLKRMVTARKSLMHTDATRRLAKREDVYQLPPRFFDDVRDGAQPPGAHPHSSAYRLSHSSASPPHALFNRLSSLLHRSQNTNHPVEVVAVRDKQALYVSRRPERPSDMAARIRNPTWWNRCILFICCVSLPPDANDAQDTGGHQ